MFSFYTYNSDKKIICNLLLRTDQQSIQENKMILNIPAPNNRISKYLRQKLIQQQRKQENPNNTHIPPYIVLCLTIIYINCIFYTLKVFSKAVSSKSAGAIFQQHFHASCLCFTFW